MYIVGYKKASDNSRRCLLTIFLKNIELENINTKFIINWCQNQNAELSNVLFKKTATPDNRKSNTISKIQVNIFDMQI